MPAEVCQVYSVAAGSGYFRDGVVGYHDPRHNYQGDGSRCHIDNQQATHSGGNRLISMIRGYSGSCRATPAISSLRATPANWL